MEAIEREGVRPSASASVWRSRRLSRSWPSAIEKVYLSQLCRRLPRVGLLRQNALQSHACEQPKRTAAPLSKPTSAAEWRGTSGEGGVLPYLSGNCPGRSSRKSSVSVPAARQGVAKRQSALGGLHQLPDADQRHHPLDLLASTCRANSLRTFFSRRIRKRMYRHYRCRSCLPYRLL